MNKFKLLHANHFHRVLLLRRSGLLNLKFTPPAGHVPYLNDMGAPTTGSKPAGEEVESEVYVSKTEP